MNYILLYFKDYDNYVDKEGYCKLQEKKLKIIYLNTENMIF